MLLSSSIATVCVVQGDVLVVKGEVLGALSEFY